MSEIAQQMYNERTQLDSTAAWMDVAAGGAGRADHATTWACSKQAPNLQSACGQTIIILQRHGEIKTTWMFLKDSPPTTFRIVFNSPLFDMNDLRIFRQLATLLAVCSYRPSSNAARSVTSRWGGEGRGLAVCRVIRSAAHFLLGGGAAAAIAV